MSEGSSVRTCKACHKILDTKSGEPTIFAVSCENEDFCPRCFVYVRAPLEPARWGHRLSAYVCGRCFTEFVDFGTGVCPHCSTRPSIALPPVQPLKDLS